MHLANTNKTSGFGGDGSEIGPGELERLARTGLGLGLGCDGAEVALGLDERGLDLA